MGTINCGEFTEMVAFKRPSKSRTSTGAVEKKFVDAGKAYVKLEYKTIGESVDDTYRVVVKGKEYEILSTVEVNRRFMVITAKML